MLHLYKMQEKTQKTGKTASLGGPGLKIIMFLIVLYTLVFQVSAYENRTFNNSLASENITFIGLQNNTRYLSVPENTFVVDSYLNLTLNNTDFSFWVGDSRIFNFTQENTVKIDYGESFTNGQTISSGQSEGQAFNATSTYSLYKIEAPLVARTGLVNISIEIRPINSTGGINSTVLGYNYTFNANSVTTNAYPAIEWYNITIPQNPVLTQNSLYVILFNWSSGGSLQVGYKNTARTDGGNKFESVNKGLTWYIVPLAQNGFRTYTSGGNVNVPLTTTNLTTPINNYLAGCSYAVGICSVPFIFENFAGNGTVTYNNLFVNSTALRINNQTYNASTYETKREGYFVNITPAYNYTLATANLVLNSVPYSATTTIDGPNLLFNAAVDTAVGITSNSFYWNLSIVNTTDTVYVSTTPVTQTVNPIYLTACNSTVGNKTLNFTFADEQTLTLFNGTMNAIFNYSIGTGSVTKLYSYNNLSTREVNFCLSPKLNFTSDISINYNNYNSTAGYGTRFFSQQKYILNDTLQNITLYSLLTSASTTFIIQVQDNNLLGVSNAVVETYQFNPTLNKFILVQTGLTDGSGQTTGQFIVNTVNYQFIVKQNNQIIYISPIQAVIPTTAPYTITLAIGSLIPNPLNPLIPINNLVTGIVFNKTTNMITWTYQDSSGNFSSSLFIVAIQNYSNGHDYVVCNMTSTNINAIRICDLTVTGNRTGVYYANAYITRGSSRYLVDNLSFVIENFSSIMGGLGIILGMFIIIICAMTFKFNEIVGVWMTTISVLVVNMLGLISFGPVFITGIIAVAIILTVMFKN